MDPVQIGHQCRIFFRCPGRDLRFHVIGQDGVKHRYLFSLQDRFTLRTFFRCRSRQSRGANCRGLRPPFVDRRGRSYACGLKILAV